MLHTIYFIYGLCVMFYFMMSWLFFHKDKELLSRLVAVLMLVIGVQCLKNLYFIKPINDPNEIRWMMTIASDVVAIPLYAFILIELCSPTSLTRRRAIFLSLVFILILWIANSIYADYIIEALYMSISLVVWMFISYYIYKHESVLDELSDSQYIDMQDDTATITKDTQIGKRIAILFEKEKVYLNPNLKVSDIAATIGTNRTYVSAYFNKETQCTFYDYVNRFRIEYACKQLDCTDDKIVQIAETSGFNSAQAFIRVFIKIKGISPNKYRKEKNR